MLLGSNDWDAACNRYAAEHDNYYGALHTITSRLLYLFGKDALRAGLVAPVALQVTQFLQPTFDARKAVALFSLWIISPDMLSSPVTPATRCWPTAR